MQFFPHSSRQGRLHHRKLGANAPKKISGGGRFDVEPGGNVFEKNICRVAAVIFSGFSDKQNSCY